MHIKQEDIKGKKDKTYGCSHRFINKQILRVSRNITLALLSTKLHLLSMLHRVFGSGHETVVVFAPALPELLWLPTVWRCPYIEIAFSTLDCSIVPTCGAWCSATAAKRGPLKQSWAEIQHSRDDEPLGVLMQMRNVRVNGFFFFSSLGVLPGVLVDTLSLCSGDFCVECVLIVLHKFYIELYKKYNWLDPGPSMRFDEIIILFCNKCR